MGGGGKGDGDGVAGLEEIGKEKTAKSGMGERDGDVRRLRFECERVA